MKHNYEKAMQIELRFEGGKVDDPRDPGGRTNQGVIQRVYSAYRGRKGLPVADVYNMTDAERNEIYREQYANKIRFDELPSGIDLFVLDGAINSGPAQSIKWLQRALGLTADGVMGDVTLNAACNQIDNDAVIARMAERRMLFLRQLKHWPTYKKGWTARVMGVKAKAQAWATGANDTVPIEYSEVGADKKANLTQANAVPSRGGGDVTGGVGGTLTTMSTGIETAKDTLLPVSDNAWVSKVLIGLAILGVIMAAVGFGYSYYARAKKREMEDALDLTPQDAPYNNANTPTEILDLSIAPNDYQGAPAIKSL